DEDQDTSHSEAHCEIVAMALGDVGRRKRSSNKASNSGEIHSFLPMSESRGKVTGLMETNSETQAPESETTAAPSRFAELQQLVAGRARDFEKFYKDGNKAAGTGFRNAMKELKTFAKSVREEILTMRNQGKDEPQ